MNIILIAIPFFFLLIGLELWADWYRKTQYYRLNDAISSLALGIVSRATDIAKKFVPFTIYALLVDHIALVSLPDTPWVWLLAFVLYDFCYYWTHRMSHEINILWAAHVVHHSSEEYNLTTALRQTSSGFFTWIFYIPLALLGIPWEMFVAVGALNLVYQFWVHTRHVPKLGWYENIFVTPSNHRVHHAQNQVYIDRNYGGVFITWDRLFGTFQEELEDEPCIYGIRKPLKSWNPVWANLHFYWQLIKDAWRTDSWKAKFVIWFKPTGWRPEDVAEKYPMTPADLSKFKKFDIQITGWQKVYALLQHIVVVIATLTVMLQLASFDQAQIVAGVLFIIYASYSLSLTLSNHRWFKAFELVKHGSFLGLMQMLSVPVWLSQISLGAVVISLLVLVMAVKQGIDAKVNQLAEESELEKDEQETKLAAE